MFLVDMTGFLIGLILLAMLIVTVTIFAVAMWKEYQGEYFRVKDLMDDTGKVIKTFFVSVRQALRKIEKRSKRTGKPRKDKTSDDPKAPMAQGHAKEWTKVYQARPLMAKEEAAHFRKIQRWGERRNYVVLAKVRLADLVASRVDPQVSMKPAMIIQSKCIDFVVCDQAMNVRCAIVICGGQKFAKRIEVDRFVADVLKACGYNVLMTDTITEKGLDKACDI